jgi:hypothetical protein
MARLFGALSNAPMIIDGSSTRYRCPTVPAAVDRVEVAVRPVDAGIQLAQRLDVRVGLPRCDVKGMNDA